LRRKSWANWKNRARVDRRLTYDAGSSNDSSSVTSSGLMPSLSSSRSTTDRSGSAGPQTSELIQTPPAAVWAKSASANRWTVSGREPSAYDQISWVSARVSVLWIDRAGKTAEPSMLRW
jgi:hypothetical protein